MSRDIRSFFTVLSKKPVTTPQKTVAPAPKKKPKRLVDSDDEDVVAPTPEQKPTKKQKREVISSESDDDKTKQTSSSKAAVVRDKKRPKREIISSDSEEDTSKSKKVPLKGSPSKLKTVDVKDFFTKAPIKQSKVEVVEKPPPVVEKEVKKSKAKKKKSDKNTELGIHGDNKFEETLLELDNDLFEENLDVLEKTATEALLQENDNGMDTSVKDAPKGKARNGNVQTSKKEAAKEEKEAASERKRSRTDSSSDRNTPKKKKIEHTDSGIDPGQEAHEKKRYSAMLYQKYLNRSGPKHHGMKELPQGKPDCLKNLCFLKTGVLDSLESEEFENLITRHGGRVVHGVSKKVNYVVIGEDPGPAKVAKAESYNIPRITEDEFLDLILTKSGKDAKYCKKDSSGGSEDLGIEADVTSSVKIKNEKTSEKQQNGENIPSKAFYGEASTSKVQPAEEQPEEDSSSVSLIEKYKPRTLSAVIGQQGDGSNLQKLRHWLENWYKNQNPKVKKTLVKPSPWAKKDDGAYFKCALLSGPPGVGKTTSATLVATDLGFDIVEFNASDTRSKKLLHQEVSQLLSTNTIAGFATGKSKIHKKRVLLMDEVDGMAGNEDRGGIQELIQLIKNSNIPIICMCNDRNHQKMRSLVNYCFDLKFTKPKMPQIRGAMMSICFKEKINITPQALSELILGTGCDVRQTLNHLALLASRGREITMDEVEKEAKTSKKDTVMGPWEVCRTVFTKSEHQNMSVIDKARLFFYDYSLGPLFVQENYLKVQPAGNKKQALLKAAFAAEAISMGNIVDTKIRRTNNWSLLESQAMFSSVLPGHYMSGEFVGQINFPAWLGKNSKKNKFTRLISEIQLHTRTSACASKLAIKLDYLLPLRNAVVLPLKKGAEGINEAVEVMKTYKLLREDVDNLLELCQWQRGDNPMNSVATEVKRAFTRAYNKQVGLLPYAPASGISKKKAAALESDLIDDEEAIESDEEDDDISKNAMIKVKKPTARGKKTEEAGSSKKTDSKKGKGRKK